MTRAIYKMDLQGRLNDVPVMNSLYWITPQTECTFAEAKQIADEFVGTGLSAGYCDCLSDNYTLEAIRVRGIVVELDTDPVTYDSPVSTAAYITFAGNQAGTRTGTIQSNQSGPLISYLPATEPGERPRVNKLFLPGVNEADADDDGIAAGLRTAMQTFVDALLLGIVVGSGTAQVIGIIKKTGVAATVISLARTVLAMGIEFFVASQRNRRPRLH